MVDRRISLPGGRTGSLRGSWLRLKLWGLITTVQHYSVWAFTPLSRLVPFPELSSGLSSVLSLSSAACARRRFRGRKRGERDLPFRSVPSPLFPPSTLSTQCAIVIHSEK